MANVKVAIRCRRKGQLEKILVPVRQQGSAALTASRNDGFVAAVDRIAASARQGRLAILAGAGISVPSDLPEGDAVVSSLVSSLRKKAAEAKLDPSSHLPNTAISTIRPEVALDVLRSTHLKPVPMRRLFSGFKQAVPSQAHFLIAQLLFFKHVSRVFTTNYDELIEDAYTHVALLAGAKRTKLRVVLRSPALSRIRSHGHLLKVHGSLATDPILAVSQFASIPIPLLTHFRETLRDFDLLILGYSGRDDFSLRPVILATESDRAIFWVEHLTSTTHDILTLRSNPSTECISARDRAYALTIPTHNVRSFVVRRRSLLIRCDTERLVAALSTRFRLSEIAISHFRPLEPLIGIQRWINHSLTPEGAALCLIKLYRRSIKPKLLWPHAKKMVALKRHKRRPPDVRAQLHFEFAVLSKEIGAHRMASAHFRRARVAALEWNTRDQRSGGSMYARIEQLVHTIQKLWGFSLKDEGFLAASERVFSERVLPFSADIRAQIEVFWVMKDTQRLEQGIAQLRSISHRRGRRRDAAKGSEYLSWALLDFARARPYSERRELWLEGLQHIDRAVRIYAESGESHRHGHALRSAGMQRLHMAEQVFTKQGPEDRKLSQFVSSGFVKKSQDAIQRAQDIFVALEDLGQQVYMLAARVLSAYVGGQIALGDALLAALEKARREAPLTAWERAIWVPKERRRLRAIRARLLRRRK